MKAELKREHAVVIGSGLAGASAARALANHFHKVTLIERDELPVAPAFRAGVPQGRHAHLLLRRGQQDLESLFPGFTKNLQQAGAVPLSIGTEVRWYQVGGWRAAHAIDFQMFACSRILVEHTVRKMLATAPNVEMLAKTRVAQLIADDTRTRVTGVMIERDHGAQMLACDFVVDAAGRSSKAKEWLEALGYAAPTDTVINPFVAYATRVYKKPATDRPWKALLVHPSKLSEERVGIVWPIENNQWVVTLAGLNKMYPPGDPEGFLAYAKSLAQPDLYDAIKDAEPVSEVYPYRRTENRFRHYESLERYLEGFVVLGDAACAFNPFYAQGMSTAATGAKLLDECLSKMPSSIGFARAFQRRLAKRLRMPWLMAMVEDSRFPDAEGANRSWLVRLFQLYRDQFLRGSKHDAQMHMSLLNVLHLVSSPTELVRPLHVLKTFKTLLTRPTTKGETTAASSGEVSRVQGGLRAQTQRQVIR